MDSLDPDVIAAHALRLLAARDTGASLCPSEAARAVVSATAQATDAWRAAMPAVRSVMFALACDGVVRVTRGAHEVDPRAPGRGPIRVRRGPGFPASAGESSGHAAPGLPGACGP